MNIQQIQEQLQELQQEREQTQQARQKLIDEVINKKNISNSSIDIDWRIKDTIKELEADLLKLDKQLYKANEEAENQKTEIKNKYAGEVEKKIKEEASKLLESILKFKVEQDNILDGIYKKTGTQLNFNAYNISRFEKDIRKYINQ